MNMNKMENSAGVMLKLSIVAFALLVLQGSGQQTQQAKKPERFRVIYEWKTFDFQWANQSDRQEAIRTKKYIPENIIVSGVNYYDNKFYLTLPRMKDGVPATLVTIPAIPENNTHPLLTPFPNWEMNKLGDCNAFQFIQNVQIDKQGTMWIIDNGRTGTMNPNPNTTCPAMIILMNLKDGKNAMVRYNISEEVARRKSSYLNDLVIDDTDGGYAYITDNSAVDPGIIVFRRKDGKSWKVRDSNSMSAAQNAVSFNVNDIKVNMSINIDGIALGPRVLVRNNTIDRMVYYCPMSSYRLYSIPASYLRKEIPEPTEAETMRFVTDHGVKSSQTDGMIMDNEGILYFGLIGNHSIAQWDSTKKFQTNQYTIARDKTFIQWPDRFCFDNDSNMYVMVNKLHNFVAGKTNSSEVNFRILKSRTGTKSYLYGPSAEDFYNVTNAATTAAADGNGTNASEKSESHRELPGLVIPVMLSLFGVIHAYISRP